MFLDLRKVHVDPWSPEYGAQAPVSELDETPQLDTDVELPAARWTSIEPPSVGRSPVLFVDGVRRVDARLQYVAEGRVIHGVLASYAVGVALAGGDNAQLGEYRVERAAVMGTGELLADWLEVAPGLAYAPASTADSDPDAPLRRVQHLMRLHEASLARDLAAGGTLTVLDGRLSLTTGDSRPLVGLIKRVHELYLPATFLDHLVRLPRGHRTPAFCIYAGAMTFYSWFLRLAEPGPGASPLHGLARLEVAGDAGLDAALRLASATTALLPRFVPHRSRDPRAPQNLLPVGALERHLQHKLGDARLVRRLIETRIAQETTHDRK
jgi:hypothetical protein